jgi:hypothetical protein
MNCVFSNPQEIATGSWAYSEMTCLDPRFELIQNASTGAEFYIEKTINYGEAVFVVFATLFAIYLICISFWRFFWK